MKGLSNFLPSFTRIAISLLCTLCITSNVLAQDKTATVNVKDVTVKELLKAIEAGSTYTFAYVDTDIDLTKKVTISATDKDIETIIKEVLQRPEDSSQQQARDFRTIRAEGCEAGNSTDSYRKSH